MATKEVPSSQTKDDGIELTEKVVLLRTRAQDLSSVKKLNCWASKLKDVQIVRQMSNLEVCSLSINKITTLRDFAHCHKLQELYVRMNQISDLGDVHYLKNLRRLRSLWLAENPCASGEKYRATVLRALPSLQKLDNVSVTDEELTQALLDGEEIEMPEGFSMSSVFTDPGLSTDDSPSDPQGSRPTSAGVRKRRVRRKDKPSDSDSGKSTDAISTDDNTVVSPRGDGDGGTQNGGQHSSGEQGNNLDNVANDSGGSLTLSGSRHIRKSELRRNAGDVDGVQVSIDSQSSMTFPSETTSSSIISDASITSQSKSYAGLDMPCGDEKKEAIINFSNNLNKNSNNPNDSNVSSNFESGSKSKEVSLLDNIELVDSMDTSDHEKDEDDFEFSMEAIKREIPDSIDLCDLNVEIDKTEDRTTSINNSALKNEIEDDDTDIEEELEECSSVADSIEENPSPLPSDQNKQINDLGKEKQSNISNKPELAPKPKASRVLPVPQQKQSVNFSESNSSKPESSAPPPVSQSVPVKAAKSSPIDWEEYNRLRVELGVGTRVKPSASVSMAETSKTRNSNVLSAVLSLVKELDKDSLDIVAAAVNTRRNALSE